MSGFCDDGAGDSFGIEGYFVPKSPPSVPGYSMPKAKLQAGSAFAPVGIGGEPGPCEYFKDQKKFGHNSRGGFISKSERDKLKHSHGNTASSGGSTKDTKASPMDSEQLMPRVTGGMMAKRDRGCYLFDKATSQSRHRVAPCKYSPQYLDAKPQTVSFGTPRKGKPRCPPEAHIGPGHYEVKNPGEKHAPEFSVPRNPAKSYLDTLTKHSGATPGPGHHLGLNLGLQAGRVEDREGARMHSARLLAEHILTPRRVSQ